MQVVKATGSKIEERLGKTLWKANIRYRKHYKKLPGKPDFVLVRFKWDERKHDHKTNKEFWYKKIERNIERDKEVNNMLKEMGWKVIRFWEHEIKEDVEKCVTKVKEKINQ